MVHEIWRFYLVQQAIGIDEHHVAAQDSSGGIPAGVHGRLSTPQGRSIHNIIVHQAKIVKQLNGQWPAGPQHHP